MPRCTQLCCPLNCLPSPHLAVDWPRSAGARGSAVVRRHARVPQSPQALHRSRLAHLNAACHHRPRQQGGHAPGLDRLQRCGCCCCCFCGGGGGVQCCFTAPFNTVSYMLTADFGCVRSAAVSASCWCVSCSAAAVLLLPLSSDTHNSIHHPHPRPLCTLQRLLRSPGNRRWWPTMWPA